MTEADDLREADFVSTTTTTKRAVTLGSWGGGRMNNFDSNIRKQKIQHDGLLSDWEVKKTISSKINDNFQQASSTASSSRRLSDHSRISSEREDDNESFSSTRNNRSTKQSPEPLTHRSRFAVDFFTDDFDDAMDRMISDFDARFSKSLWLDDDETLFQRRKKKERLVMDEDFSSRPCTTRSRAPPSIFNSKLDGFLGEKKLNLVDEYAESGVYSNGSSSRLSQRVDDALSSETQPDHGNPPMEKFEVDINVQGYKAHDLQVSTDGHRLIITARKKDDDGNPFEETRDLKREFVLPEGVNPYKVTSNLLPNGILKVEAPIGNSKVLTSQLKEKEKTTKLQEDKKI